MDISANQSTQSDKLQSTSTPTKQAWTPGPWRVPDKDFRIFQLAKNEDGTTIGLGRFVCCTAHNNKERTPESAANAKLIAKAPEMAQLLIDFVAYSECHCTYGKGDCIFCAAGKVLREAGAL